MNIALAFPGCHRRGGVERVMVECANFLSGRGHDVTVYASDWDADVLTSAVRRHDLPVAGQVPALRLPAFRRALASALDGSNPQPDVIGTFGAVCPRRSVVWVQSVHAAWIEISRSRRDFAGRLKQRLNPYHPMILRMERETYGKRRYKRLIALSDAVKADLIRCYCVPEADISVLPNGYAPAEFDVRLAESKREAMRRKLGFGPNDRVVVFVANETERKGFGQLLRAMASLNDPSLRLLAVGRLSTGRYAAEIRALGMDSRVLFTGPSATVADFYAAADAFALPTQYEAWGLVITEALACGLPVLTSRLAGAAVSVHDGKNGWLLEDPQDEREIACKLKGLLEGVTYSRSEIAQSVQDLSWPNILSRYEAVLMESATK